MTLEIVTGKPIIKWTADRIGAHFSDLSYAIGVVEGDLLLAGIVYANFTGHNLEMSIATTTPRWCNRRVLSAAFAYPFVNLRCRRVTSLVEVDNKRSWQLAQRLGFTIEGFHRALSPDGKDMISLGLLRENCSWLRDGESPVVSDYEVH